MSVEFRKESELASDDSTPGVTRSVAFETEDAVMVQSRVAPRVETGWHHHGDRHVFGFLLEGRGVLDHGPDGRERSEGEAPGFFHIPPGVVHRDTNPGDTDQLSVITFVGSGPIAVEAPAPE